MLEQLNSLATEFIEPVSQIRRGVVENGITPTACEVLLRKNPEKALRIAAEQGRDHIIYLLATGKLERSLKENFISQPTILILLPAIAELLPTLGIDAYNVFDYLLSSLNRDDVLVSMTIDSISGKLCSMIDEAKASNKSIEEEKFEQLKQKLLK